jgi:N-acetylglucosaminyl-diphospho-decaprenol L-rhamnosyltransferase
MASSKRRLTTSSAVTSVIVVAFNSESTLEACLQSIPASCDVVLVDQHSSDGSVAVAERVRPKINVIKAGANRGFGAGCNLGAANAIGDVLVFLNPDAAFASPESVHLLSESAITENALVGPRVLDPTGVEQTRARYWSTILSELGEIFLPVRLSIGIFRRDIPRNHEVYRTGGRVPYIQGCCMAISGKNFWRVNGFDERMFLYREEETLALNLDQVGVNVRLEPRAVISHVGGTSTSQHRDFSAGQYYRSEALFLSLRYSKRVAVPAILTLWLVLLGMAALTPIRRIIGLRADKGASWYIAAAKGVMSGWRRKLVVAPKACGS